MTVTSRSICILSFAVILLVFAPMLADGATVRWRGTDAWGDGTWDINNTADFRDTGGTPTVYLEGDDARFVLLTREYFIQTRGMVRYYGVCHTQVHARMRSSVGDEP